MEEFINNVSVDCVIFGFNNKTLNVLLTKRELKDPETGEIIFTDYTVQGHHVLKGENINDAAVRVLKDKTGLDNIYLEQFYAFGSTDRVLADKDQLWLKRRYSEFSNRIITVGYYSLIDNTTANLSLHDRNAQWFH